jgi:uncharacterized protein (DUF111 family)
MFKYIFILLLLSSCSAQWHYERACQKDTAYCGTDILIDTMLITDTLYYHRVDTTNMIDTITIDTGSIQVKIIRNHDVIRTYIKQKPDTTRLTIYKKVPPKIIEKFIYPWWLFLLIPLTLWLILRK